MTTARIAIQRAAALLRDRTYLSQGSLFGESGGIGGQGRLFGPHAEGSGGGREAAGKTAAADGHWVTIHGHPVMIRCGQSVGDALRNHFKGTPHHIDQSHVAGAGRQIKLQGGRPNIEPHHLRPETWGKQPESAKPAAEPTKPAVATGRRVIETAPKNPVDESVTPGQIVAVHDSVDAGVDAAAGAFKVHKPSLKAHLESGKPWAAVHGTFQIEGASGAPKVPDNYVAATPGPPAVAATPAAPPATSAAPAPAALHFKPDDHVSVSGNTFPHRAVLAKAGFAFDKASKSWTGPYGNLPGALAGTKFTAAAASTKDSLANADHVGKAFDYGRKRLGESKITGWNLFKDYGGDTQLIEGIKKAGGTVNAEGHASITRGGHTLTVKPSVGVFPGRASLMRNDDPAHSPATDRNAGVVDPNRQLGMFAADAAGNAVEVGEKVGQGSLFGSTKKPPAAPPVVKTDDQKLRDKFDEKATPSMFGQHDALTRKMDELLRADKRGKYNRPGGRDRLAADAAAALGGGRLSLSAAREAAIEAGNTVLAALEATRLQSVAGDFLFMSASTAGVQYLSAACSIRDAVTVGQGLPKKINGLDVHYRWCDAAYAGDWAHPKTGRAVPITPTRIDDWVGKIKLSRSRGVNLPVCKDHQETADNSVGEIFDARRTGNRLDLLLGFKGDDALKIGQRNYLSIGIDGNFKDSRKNAYGEAIRHVAVTPVPVIHGQTGFLPN